MSYFFKNGGVAVSYQCPCFLANWPLSGSFGCEMANPGQWVADHGHGVSNLLNGMVADLDQTIYLCNKNRKDQ